MAETIVEVDDGEGRTYRVTFTPADAEGRRVATVERRKWYGFDAALLPTAAKAKRLVRTALAQLEAAANG